MRNDSASREKSSSSGKDSLFRYVMIVTGIVILVVGAMIRFANPEMTETQLFTEYWEFWISSIVVAVVVSWLSKKLF